MSTLVGTMHHPVTSQPELLFKGFSWPCLFLGVFWYMVKGMWKWAAISVLVVILTSGLAWIVFAFINNKQHVKHLIEKGYLPDDKTRTYLITNGLITENYPKFEK